jgi:hypothetical protein
MFPAIYGDNVVWEDWRNGQPDIYIVTDNEAEPRGMLSGYVKLQNAASHTTQITFELRFPNTTVVIANASNDEDRISEGTQISTENDGKYTLSDIPEGRYDITAESSKWLRQKRGDVSVSRGGVLTVA